MRVGLVLGAGGVLGGAWLTGGLHAPLTGPDGRPAADADRSAGADFRLQGRNLMSAARRQRVIETAEQTVREQLRRPEARALLGDLPKGEPHKIRRPAGPPASWPRLDPPLGTAKRRSGSQRPARKSPRPAPKRAA